MKTTRPLNPGRLARTIGPIPGGVTDAYAAGLFDGEGSVIINRVNARVHSLCCTMHLTDRAAIGALHARFGGSLNTVKRRAPRHREIWSWRVSGAGAERFLLAIRPFLIVKAAQADLAFEFRAGHQDAHRLTPDERVLEYDRRERYKAAMQSLNRPAA